MQVHSVGTILTDATKVTVYKVPTGYYAKWNLCYVINHAGANKNVDAIWYDSSETTEFFVLDDYTLATKSFVKFDGGAYVVLDEGDEIRAAGDASASFHMINTFELIRK